jgi:hypothetical protein
MGGGLGTPSGHAATPSGQHRNPVLPLGYTSLDLGWVEVIAGVRVTGKNLGTLCKTPYRVNIFDAVRPSGNGLEIQRWRRKTERFMSRHFS